jgi:hypothetical protein
MFAPIPLMEKPVKEEREAPPGPRPWMLRMRAQTRRLKVRLLRAWRTVWEWAVKLLRRPEVPV